MPEPIRINIPNPPEATPALLDDPEFRTGFAMGIVAYFDEVEENERPFTTQEVCQEIRRDLDPKVRQNGYVSCAIIGCPPIALAHEMGFLAGWIAAHMAATPPQGITLNA